MATRPPLHLHLLAHPKSEEGNHVADALMTRFVEPPASGGLRIPVFFTPDRGNDLPPSFGPDGGLNLDAAEHTIVVVLADKRMARVVEGGTGDQWKTFIQELISQAPVGASPHHVLPVALDPRGFDLSERQHFLPAPLEAQGDDPEAADRRLSEISLYVAARAIQLLEFGKITEKCPNRIKAPVRIFISHAKADLEKDKQDPAHQTMNALSVLPIEHWYDAAEIATSQEFEDAISAGIKDCSILVAFHTDHYGSRPWCRREVLVAKKMGAQLLLVDALKEGEPRRFPYLGNVPTVRWRFADPAADARRVINRAVLEALRFKHNRAKLNLLAEEGDSVLAAAPEAVTLAYEYGDIGTAKTFLYPDPPLGREELDVLRHLRPDATFLTPLTRVARWQRPANIDTIAVSISNSNDPERYGMSLAHQQTLTDEIHLYLLLAGLRIAYGGALQGDFSDASNFTLRLFELVRSYAPLAQAVEASQFHPIVNYAPWPLHLVYGDRELNFFGKEAVYEKGPRPELPWTDEQIFPEGGEGWRLAPSTAEKRYAWARGLGAMREQVTQEAQARLVIAGDLRKFQGIISGVVEEAWLSLKHRKPLYLVGAFGGAARAVADVSMGGERTEFSEDDARAHVPDYDAAVDCYAKHGGVFTSMADIGREIRELSGTGLASALNNGLDDAENEELILCPEATRIAELVLAGLSRLPA